MNLLSVIIMSISLSVDCLTISMAYAARMKHWRWTQMLTVAFVFGLAQGVMPIVGWMAGMGFENFFERWDAWISFGVLLFIGLRMIINAFLDRKKRRSMTYLINWRSVVLLAFLTNVDALTVGVMFVSYRASFSLLVICLAMSGFLFSLVGSLIGRYSYHELKFGLSVVGGILLLFLGVHTLLGHSVFL